METNNLTKMNDKEQQRQAIIDLMVEYGLMGNQEFAEAVERRLSELKPSETKLDRKEWRVNLIFEVLESFALQNESIYKIQFEQISGVIDGLLLLEEKRKPSEDLVQRIKSSLMDRSYFGKCNMSGVKNGVYENIEKDIWFLPEDYFDSASTEISKLLPTNEGNAELLEALKAAHLLLCECMPSVRKSANDKLLAIAKDGRYTQNDYNAAAVNAHNERRRDGQIIKKIANTIQNAERNI